jgi:DNA-binding NarL/FixJ family response regulator
MTYRHRILIVDDHDVVCIGLAEILNAEADMEVVTPAVQDDRVLFDRLRETKPPIQILILDAKMPNLDLLATLDRARLEFPALRVIICTALQDPQLVKAAAARGAAGFILKEEALSKFLPNAIRDVGAGRRWFSPRASQSFLDDPSQVARSLTELQMDILRRMVAGEKTSAIAEHTHRAASTIYNLQSQIRDALDVQTNTKAVAKAIVEGLVNWAD